MMIFSMCMTPPVAGLQQVATAMSVATVFTR
jgi:hypothetical protein